MKYRARPGYGFTNNDATIIGNYLSKEFPDGNYTVDEIIDRARDKSCPLHQYYTWDVKKAALQHWRQQTRQLITCYFVVIDGVQAPAAVSVRMRASDNKSYLSTEFAIHNEDIWGAVLAEALQGLQSWKFRYATFKQLKELKPVVNEITRLEKKHGKDNSKASPRGRRKEGKKGKAGGRDNNTTA